MTLTNQTNEPAQAWAGRPLNEIIDFVLRTYHEPLVPALRRLTGLLAQVPAARGAPLAPVLAALRDELEQHLLKEERILFPWLLSSRGASAGAPVRVMHMEHESTRQQLAALRALTQGYQADGDEAWRALCAELAALERDMEAHMRLEEEVVFPRGLGQE